MGKKKDKTSSENNHPSSSTNNTKTSSRKKSLQSDSRKPGCFCPIDCILTTEVDPKVPGKASKFNCSNKNCPEVPFIHQECLEMWESKLVDYLRRGALNKRAVAWTEHQAYISLWAKKGYDVVYPLCECFCGHGHIRKDMDYDVKLKASLEKSPSSTPNTKTAAKSVPSSIAVNKQTKHASMESEKSSVGVASTADLVKLARKPKLAKSDQFGVSRRVTSNVGFGIGSVSHRIEGDSSTSHHIPVGFILPDKKKTKRPAKVQTNNRSSSVSNSVDCNRVRHPTESSGVQSLARTRSQSRSESEKSAFRLDESSLGACGGVVNNNDSGLVLLHNRKRSVDSSAWSETIESGVGISPGEHTNNSSYAHFIASEDDLVNAIYDLIRRHGTILINDSRLQELFDFCEPMLISNIMRFGSFEAWLQHQTKLRIHDKRILSVQHENDVSRNSFTTSLMSLAGGSVDQQQHRTTINQQQQQQQLPPTWTCQEVESSLFRQQNGNNSNRSTVSSPPPSLFSSSTINRIDQFSDNSSSSNSNNVINVTANNSDDYFTTYHTTPVQASTAAIVSGTNTMTNGNLRSAWNTALGVIGDGRQNTSSSMSDTPNGSVSEQPLVAGGGVTENGYEQFSADLVATHSSGSSENADVFMTDNKANGDIGRDVVDVIESQKRKKSEPVTINSSLERIELPQRYDISCHAVLSDFDAGCSYAPFTAMLRRVAENCTNR